MKIFRILYFVLFQQSALLPHTTLVIDPCQISGLLMLYSVHYFVEAGQDMMNNIGILYANVSFNRSIVLLLITFFYQ